MKIKFANGTEGNFEITHEYCGCERDMLKVCFELKQRFTETVNLLRVLQEKSPGAAADAERLIKEYEQELRYIKGEITEYRKRPVKTIVTFEYDGETIEAFSKISEDDAYMGLHCSRIGRQQAIRNLLKKLTSVLSRDQRKEFVARFLPEFN